MKTKSTFKFISALVLMAGGCAFSAMGCIGAEPELEETAEAELAVGRGGACNPFSNPTGCNTGLVCLCSNGDTCIVPNSGICCNAWEDLCGTTCTSLDTDRNNCGACGHKCLVSQYCAGGTCELY